MQNLGFYFDLGWHHIITRDAFDHLLFVLVLCAVYSVSEWRKLLILVTAFTLGHSLTLVLGGLDIVRINSDLVEILIPCTILVTAVVNLWPNWEGAMKRNYFLAFFFGLIHGLGFANAIRFMMLRDERLGVNFFGFNLGLEAGQIVVVVGILVLYYLLVSRAGLKRILWIRGISVIAILVSAKMIGERFSIF